MDDEDLEARIAAKQAKKKKKSASTGEIGADGAPVRKKKKKKKPASTSADGGSTRDITGDNSAILEDRIRAKQSASSGGDRDTTDTGGEGGGGGGAKPRKKKKKRRPKLEDQTEATKSSSANVRGTVDDNDNNGEGVAVAVATTAKAAVRYNDEGGAHVAVAASATAAVATREGVAVAATATATASVAVSSAAMQSMEEDLEAKGGYDNNYDEEGGVELVEKERYNDNDSDDVIELEQEGMMGNGNNNNDENEMAYCFEADTEIMAEINQEGLVQVDESGGIQAFVAETIAIDGDDVGIIKSDAEIEKEEKKKYTKYFCGAVAVLVVVIIAVAVPITLKYAKGRQETRITEITQDPTTFPSLMPSDVPSSMPSSVRFTEIIQQLEPLSGDALKVQGSPQYKAAMWMADGDLIPNLGTGGTGLDLDDARFEQRYVMALFYYAMDGNNWEENQGWLGEESECEWFGIKGSSNGCPGGCIERSDFVGDYDKICRISMGRTNNLYGQIPSEIDTLTEIRWFEIQEDYLTGTIPESIGRTWKKLHTMLLGGNFLHGGFPDAFENNDMLGTIFIDRNLFNGTFPNVFTTLKNLEWLDAETNNFVGTIPDEISNLKSLRILNVNNNSLNGYLPDSWDENNLIEDLEVAGNKFNGPLPASLAKAKFLKDFRASRNQLTGSLPVEYHQFENLEELYLDQNKMVGELPQTAEPFYDGLQEFSIHSNDFEGRFPVEHFEKTFRISEFSFPTCVCDFYVRDATFE